MSRRAGLRHISSIVGKKPIKPPYAELVLLHSEEWNFGAPSVFALQHSENWSYSEPPEFTLQHSEAWSS